MARIRTRGRPATYSFRSSWTVAAGPERVHEVLRDLGRYPLWWPQVRAVAAVGDDAAWVLARSVLPYTLDLRLDLATREPQRLEVAITGDLEGAARWLLAGEGDGTRVTFEQDVAVTGWLARASPLLRPLLVWNHERMMAGCRAGLAGAVLRPD